MPDLAPRHDEIDRPVQVSAVPRRGAEKGTLVLIAGVALCEIAASLLVAAARRPVAGILCLGAGVAIALGWARRHRRAADRLVAGQIEAARRLLAEGSFTPAWNAACAAAEATSSPPLRNAALAVLAQVALEEKHGQAARMVLSQIRPPRAIDPWLEARLERLDGRADRAIALLEQGRGRPTFGGPAARLLVELLAEANELERAVRVAIEHLDLLDPRDTQNMIASLQAWDEHRHAAALTLAVTMRRIGFRAGRELRVSRSAGASGD